jgi:sugar O-acyltransferase (sialic acid O-acetyltransferase NeuD family)
MKQKGLLIIGAGGHGREVEWLARDVGQHELLGFIDENVAEGVSIGGSRNLGGNHKIGDYPDAEIIVAIGDLRRRKAVVQEIAERFPNSGFATLLHPSAVVPESLTLGEGTMVCAGTFLSVNVTVGSHVIVNFKAAVGHDAVVGDYCTLGPGSLTCGAAILSAGVEIGAGAVIRQRLHLATGSMAAMGAVVVKDVPENTLVAGNPARPMRQLASFTASR